VERYYWASLRMLPNISNSRLKALIGYFGSAARVWSANRQELISAGLMTAEEGNNIVSRREKIDVFRLREEWEKKRIGVLTLADPEYPSLLAKTYNPPAVLYYRGKFPVDSLLIAVVGARRASSYGRNAALGLAGALTQAGAGIVSGAARGIDTAAHEGALENKGYTVAVLGCGIDIVYPPENAKLLERIAEQGAVVSEYAPGTPPLAKFFPARNRIISGLAKGVLVVEAAEKSGSLITADFALEEGRDVFAVPGSIFSSNSKGTNRLLKTGAKLVDTVEDILEEYGIEKLAARNATQALEPEEVKVLEALAYDKPLGIEDIMQKVQLDAQRITCLLLQLELKGVIARNGGQRFARAAGRELFE